MSRRHRVVVVAPSGPTRDALEAFFAADDTSILSLRRESFLTEHDVMLEQDRLLIDGVDVLGESAAAIVLDSGMMWPVPMLVPSPEMWSTHRTRFDEYLRDERETQSFWFSVLDMLNDRLPICVNPQAAFAMHATKPDAFEQLASLPLPIAPMLLTNDEDRLAAFLREHPGPWTALSLTGGDSRTLTKEALRALSLQQEPIFLQASGGEEVCVQSVNGRVVVPEPLPPEVRDVLPEVHRVLCAPWLALRFRRAGSSWRLSDFDPSPRWEDLVPGDGERILEAIAELVRGVR